MDQVALRQRINPSNANHQRLKLTRATDWRKVSDPSHHIFRPTIRGAKKTCIRPADKNRILTFCCNSHVARQSIILYSRTNAIGTINSRPIYAEYLLQMHHAPDVVQNNNIWLFPKNGMYTHTHTSKRPGPIYKSQTVVYLSFDMENNVNNYQAAGHVSLSHTIFFIYERTVPLNSCCLDVICISPCMYISGFIFIRHSCSCWRGFAMCRAACGLQILLIQEKYD